MLSVVMRENSASGAVVATAAIARGQAYQEVNGRRLYKVPAPLPVKFPFNVHVTVRDSRERALAEFISLAAIPTAAGEADPEVKWVQLNPPTDPFTVQLKFRRAGGDYALETTAVHVAADRLPDKEKLLEV